MSIYLWLIALGFGSIALLRSFKTGRITRVMKSVASSIDVKSRSLDESFLKMPAEKKIQSLNNQKAFAVIGGVLWSAVGLAISPVGGLIVCAASYRFVRDVRNSLDEDIHKAELEESISASGVDHSPIALESSSSVPHGNDH